MLQFNTNKQKTLYQSGDRYNRMMLTGKSFMKLPKFVRYVEAICKCGKIKWVRLTHLQKGTILSCGCLKDEGIKKRATTHGLSKHPLYFIFRGMWQRCYDKNCISYNDYGAKGVIICEEWLNDFKVFYDWATSNGWVNGLQIDKDKLSPYKTGIIYSPEFCCFLSLQENTWHRNTTLSVEYNGVVKPFREWCHFLNLNAVMVYQRIHKGWDVNKAFETPKLRNGRNKKEIA